MGPHLGADYRGCMTDTSTHTHSYGKGVQAELRDPALALRKEIPEVYDGFKALHARGLRRRRTGSRRPKS